MKKVHKTLILNGPKNREAYIKGKATYPLGEFTDVCNTYLGSYQSDIGRIEIMKGDTLHTMGAINIDIKSGYNYRFLGAHMDSCTCSKQDWTIFHPNGNALVPSTNPPRVVKAKKKFRLH